MTDAVNRAQSSALPDDPPGALVAFQSREFTTFWCAGAVSNIGTWMQQITVPFVVDQLTHSTALVGVAAFCAFIPATLVGPLAGSLADRYDRRALLMWSQLGMALVAATLWALTASGAITTPLILGLVVISGIGSGLTISAWQSFVPQLVPRPALLSAVRLNSMQFTASRAIGPALGGLVLATMGASAAFGINALSFLVVIGALLTITPRPPEHLGSHGSVTSHFMEGLRYMRERQVMVVASLMVMLVALLGVSVVQLIEPFARHVLDVGPGVYGLLIGGYGLGAVLGGLIMVWYGDSLRSSLFALTGLIGMVVGDVVVGLAPVWIVGAVGLFLIGLTQVFTMVACNTAIQLNVDEGFHGRASSVFTMSFFAAAPIGTLVGGILGEITGLRPTITGFGILLAALTAWALVRYHGLRPLDTTPAISDHTIPPA